MTSSPSTINVDAARLTDWVGDRLPGTGRLRLTRMGESTGMANALFLVERTAPNAPDGVHRWVLRRPPNVLNTPSASDIGREWRILTALEGSPVPHPAPLLCSEECDVIGAPFLMMDVVDGITPVGTLPAPYDRPGNRRALGFAMVDAIADLGTLDWRARGLDGLGRPEGFLERQVGRWTRQLDRYRTREIPGLDHVASRLEADRPAAGPVGLMHGDYSPFNVMASRTDPARLAAVIDWDTGTIGDPLLDLGHMLARWTDPGEEPALLYPVDIAVRDGLPRRTELAARYAERTGLDLAHLPYYAALSLFKLAIILEGGGHPSCGEPRPDHRGPGCPGGPTRAVRRPLRLRGAGVRHALFDLHGRVAVVTGGSRGIGRAIADAFADAGAHVVVASRKLDACVRAAEEITAASGMRALPVACHVGRWADCDALADAVLAEFGRCDILVNNAGMSPLYDSLTDITEEYFDKVVGVNLRGPFRLGALLGSRMAAAGGGSIINVSSIGSLRPGGTELVYAAAKAGLNALTVGLAEAYGPAVRVNGILPGAVLTDIATHWSPADLERATQVPMGRGGTAEDFAGTALWLAGDASAWVTGTLVRVDGGAYRQMS